MICAIKINGGRMFLINLHIRAAIFNQKHALAPGAGALHWPHKLCWLQTVLGLHN